MKVLELFGGIGACSKALKRLRIDYEIVDYVEIDKYAVKSFNAIHNTNFEPQDICEWDKDIEVDLIMHGSPCQSISLAGLQHGADKGSGTRSSLMWETVRIVEKLKPKYVIWENVKNLLSKKHRHNFDAYLETMNELGYVNYYQVLNAKDYGIPQNRERVFTISIRKDINKVFTFPPKQELKLKLKDMLEDEVDEKYYLSDKMINFFYKNEQVQKEKGNGFRFGVSDGNVIAKAVTTRAGARMDDNFIKAPNKALRETLETNEISNEEVQYIDSYNRKIKDDGLAKTITTRVDASNNDYLLIKNATKKGYQEAFEGDGVNLAYPDSKTRRGRVGEQVSQTLQTSDNMGVVDGLKIRKLTPKECWRLMGFDDEDVDKASKINSNTQLYKQAGNSIVVNVLEAILTNLLLDKQEKEQTDIYDYL